LRDVGRLLRFQLIDLDALLNLVSGPVGLRGGLSGTFGCLERRHLLQPGYDAAEVPLGGLDCFAPCVLQLGAGVLQSRGLLAYARGNLAPGEDRNGELDAYGAVERARAGAIAVHTVIRCAAGLRDDIDA